jgi:signal transduction histidine kinase
MPLVTVRFLSKLVEPLAREGLPLERWIEGTDLRPRQVLDSHAPMHWHQFVELVDRAADHMGGPEQLEFLMYRLDAIIPRGPRLIVPLVVAPERVIGTLTRFLTAQTSPPLQAHLRHRPGGATLDVEVDEGERASRAVFQVLRAVVSRAGRELDVAGYAIESSIEERRARFEIRFEQRSWMERLRRRLRVRDPSSEAIAGVEEMQRDLQTTLRHMEGQAIALRQSEARNRELVEQLEAVVSKRTGELQTRNEELREMQERLIQAERLGAAQELAGSVAHTINNPLTALIGQAQMVLEDAGEPDPRIERIHRSAQRIRDVVARTLQLFRQGELDLETKDPREILEDVASSLAPQAERAGVRIEMKCEPDVPAVDVDGPLLRAALGSLGENAIEASPRGGSVELELASVPSLDVIEFRVGDSGPGIPRAMRAKVREPFFTTKPAGTGLGLAIAQGVVAGHHGRLRLLPRPGGGTIAAVELPVAADASSRPQ